MVGCYTSAEYTNATLGVRRRLVGRWEADLRGGAAQVDSSLFQVASERISSLTGGIDLNRPLRSGATFHISYDTFHQLNKGTVPFSANFDRNQVTIGFDYQLKPISLGR